MIQDSYKTESDFKENCECAYAIYDFIDHIDSNVRWFFEKCYMLNNHNKYIVDLSSYDMPDYKDFKATIVAIYNTKTKQYDISLSHKFEPL